MVDCIDTAVAEVMVQAYKYIYICMSLEILSLFGSIIGISSKYLTHRNSANYCDIISSICENFDAVVSLLATYFTGLALTPKNLSRSDH